MNIKFIILIIIIVIILALLFFHFNSKHKLFTEKDKVSNQRIVYLQGDIDDNAAKEVVESLLNLEKKSENEEIKLIIDSKGGSVTAGFAIYDTIKYLRCNVSTMAVNEAHGMAAFILASGTKGKRFASEECTITLTPLITNRDVGESQQKLIESIKTKVNEILSQNTGQDVEHINIDIENYKSFNAQQAKDYGIIDKIGMY